MDTTVLIIGGGFSGMCTAIKLRAAGIDDFVILEKAGEVGGTWRENTYPGCTVDVASPLYSFSFEPNPGWTRAYAGREELFGYARRIADKYRLRDRIRFHSEAVGGEFDEQNAQWVIDVRNSSGERSRIRAQIVVLACISLHFPSYPDISGRISFAGTSFHSARWDHDYDLTGKNVAVVGTGASAVQFVPEVAKQAARVTVYQRSASWVMPKLDAELPAALRLVFRAFPPLQKLLRGGVFCGHELLHLAQFHPRLLGALEALCLRFLRAQVPDGAVRAKLTPDYRFSCKRPLISNDYYRTFMRPNVELVTDAVTEIDAGGVHDASGKRTEVDAIIWGTGFHVQDMYKYFPDVKCRGVSVREKTERDGLRGYRGIALHGFPNVFTVTGPNAVLAHTSFILTIESNVAHIVRLIATMRRRGIASVEVTEEAERAFTEWAHGRLADAVWSVGGCTSYFVDDRLVNRVAWPGSATHQRITMRGNDLAAFTTTFAGGSARGQRAMAGRSG